MSWVDFTGQTPFLRAALSGDTATMRLLVQHGADPNLPTLAGTTPLMAAAGVNWVVAQTYTESPQARLDAVTLCLELGADVNATNSMGLTALLGAANRGSNDIIELLVKRGARLDIKDKEGRTPLRWAEGVFLAAVGAERKPATIALLERADRRAGTTTIDATPQREMKADASSRPSLLLVAGLARVETQTRPRADRRAAPTLRPPAAAKAPSIATASPATTQRTRAGGLALDALDVARRGAASRRSGRRSSARCAPA